MDYYENRHLLEPEQCFVTVYQGLVKLDRRVPGDGTKWYVATMSNIGWFYEDDTIEPGDLVERYYP